MNDQKQSEKYLKMTTQPVEKLIVRLAIPTMISMLVTTLYNLVDTVYVGHLKDINATAAVTVAFALMNIIQAVGFFFGQGSGNFISRALGNKDYDECRKMAATGFYGALITGAVILVFGMIFTEPLAVLCGAGKTPEARAYAVEYIRIILIGAPVMCASFVLNNQLRFQGNAFFAMVGLASGAVINIFLDALLVPRFKVAGAAIATVCCQFVSFTVLLITTRRFSDNVRFSFRDVSFKFKYFKEIFRGGFPSLCRQGVASVMNISLMQCCILTSTAEITAEMLQAAFGIVSKVMMFISSMVIGFGQGFQPVCGFNFGAKKYGRVRRGYFFCVCVTFAFLLTAAVLFFIFTPQVLNFIQKTNENSGEGQTIDIAVTIMRRQLTVLPLMSFVVMSNMMLQTTGDVVGASVLAMARQGLFLIPAMFLLSLLFGIEGLEWAQFTADILSALITVPFVINLLTKMKRREATAGFEKREN